MPKRHEYAVLVVPGDFVDDPTKWEVKEVRDKIEEEIDIGSNGFVEIVDLLDHAKEKEALKDEIVRLQEELDDRKNR